MLRRKITRHRERFASLFLCGLEIILFRQHGSLSAEVSNQVRALVAKSLQVNLFALLQKLLRFVELSPDHCGPAKACQSRALLPLWAIRDLTIVGESFAQQSFSFLYLASVSHDRASVRFIESKHP